MTRRISLASIGALVFGAITSTAARADSTSGIDVELFRPSYDTSGVFSLEGGRVMTDKDIVWKVLVGYAQRPFAAPVPGIGGTGDTSTDEILKYAATIDMTF